ncbi:flagellar basal body-associated FliL family protein [Shewanella sp.]|uniref:flagellar basal body-associated FliL family protein n=1 Tax=Shewanella sp. TaxID=50422 RepID=UPI003A972DD2
MKVVIAIILALVLAGAGVAGGIYYANQKGASASEQAEAAKVPAKPMLFFPMQRFVVSVSDANYSRYLVLELSLATKNQPFLDLLKQQAPVLRNVLVKHFANITHEQAKQAFENVADVQQQLLTQFNEALQAQEIDSQLEQVLVTNVYLQ